MAGKTRTSTAHGPTAAKKPFKHDKSAARTPHTASSNSRDGPARSAPSGAAGAARGAADRKRKADDEPEKAVVRSSLLNAPDEIDFPRGGGTALTQAEVREAQLEGENEAKAAADEVRGASVILQLSLDLVTFELQLIPLLADRTGARTRHGRDQGQGQGKAEKARARTAGHHQGEEPAAQGRLPHRTP